MTALPTYNVALETSKQDKTANTENWQYWTQIYAPAVEFAKACLTPNMTLDQQQAVLMASLNTLENWTRAG